MLSFLCEIKMHSMNFTCVRNICRMSSCLAMDSEGQRGGFALMWKEGVDMVIQNYSSHNIDSLVKVEGHNRFRFMGYYSYADPNLRNHSQDILRTMGSLCSKVATKAATCMLPCNHA